MTRVEVSPPQPVMSENYPTDKQPTPIETTVQVKPTRPVSPSPQRAIIIPSPIKSPKDKKKQINISTPKNTAMENTPVYKRLSEARTTTVTTTEVSKESERF